MRASIRDLHREVVRIRGGGNGRGHRYPATLRTAITTHVRKRQAQGESLAAISRDLGVKPFTLQRWLDAGRPTGFRPVEVAASPTTPAPTAGPVVTMPNGLRIDGLDLPGLLVLLRALA
jgi:hypothetical protein